jgi:hypothetical protein
MKYNHHILFPFLGVTLLTRLFGPAPLAPRPEQSLIEQRQFKMSVAVNHRTRHTKLV